MVADELYNAMFEARHTARRHNHPLPSGPHHDRYRAKFTRVGMRRPHCALSQGRWLARPTCGGQLDSFLGPLLPHVEGLSGCWNTSQISMEPDKKLSARLASIYYSPRGCWKGLAAIKILSAAAKLTEQMAKDWLKKQAIWQIYFP